MRICITRSQRFTYSETFIQQQIKGLSRLCEVVTLHSGRMPAREESGRLIHSPGFWIVHTIIKALTGDRNDWFSNYGIQKFLKKQQVQLVLSNYGLSAVHMLPACRELKIPLIPHFHGYDATQKKVLAQYGDRYRELFAYAPAIIAVSKVMKVQLISIGAPAEKVKVIPYGIELNHFCPNPTAKAAFPLLLAVGRFTAKKAPQITIRAFHQILLEFPTARLMMIGGREDEFESCVKLVAQLGIQNSVEFPGVVPPEQIARLMQQAHIFVQHSVTAGNGDMEGTPNSILEAAASGLPVVSTRHGGILDAVIDGKTGYLVNEHDEKAMIQKIKQLLLNADELKRMGEQARQHMEENYSIEKQMNELYQVLWRVTGLER